METELVTAVAEKAGMQDMEGIGPRTVKTIQYGKCWKGVSTDGPYAAKAKSIRPSAETRQKARDKVVMSIFENFAIDFNRNRSLIVSCASSGIICN